MNKQQLLRILRGRKPRRRAEDNINMNLTEIGFWRVGLD